jgi:hypothetical protein
MTESVCQPLALPAEQAREALCPTTGRAARHDVPSLIRVPGHDNGRPRSRASCARTPPSCSRRVERPKTGRWSRNPFRAPLLRRGIVPGCSAQEWRGRQSAGSPIADGERISSVGRSSPFDPVYAGQTLPYDRAHAWAPRLAPTAHCHLGSLSRCSLKVFGDPLACHWHVPAVRARRNRWRTRSNVSRVTGPATVPQALPFASRMVMETSASGRW